ncbi:hypothetical protein D3C78_1897070 [compost metagenome]
MSKGFLRHAGVRILHAQAIANTEGAGSIQNRFTVVDEQGALRIKSGVLLHGLPQTLIFFRITKCVGRK